MTLQKPGGNVGATGFVGCVWGRLRGSGPQKDRSGAQKGLQGRPRLQPYNPDMSYRLEQDRLSVCSGSLVS
jgi:hypothetical protein